VLVWRRPNKEAGPKTRPAASRPKSKASAPNSTKKMEATEPTAVGLLCCLQKAQAVKNGGKPLRPLAIRQGPPIDSPPEGRSADFFGASPSHRPWTSAQARPERTFSAYRKEKMPGAFGYFFI
jgi:hypothetical protein